MSDWLDRDVALRRAAEELKALEERAGITAAMARAREGQFLPDPDASSEEYWAEEHDAVRSRTRDAYFSVADLSLRRALIAGERALNAARLRNFEIEIENALKSLGIAEAEAKRSLLPQTILLTFAGLISGAMVLGVAGGLLGAGVGYFIFAKWHAKEKRSANESKIESSAKDVDFAKESMQEILRRPSFFSASEEQSGKRDEVFDGESAYANLFSNLGEGGR